MTSISFLPSVSGPTFLVAYLPLLVAVLSWHGLAGRRSPDDVARPLPLLDPFQAAVYAGDRATITMSVAAELVNRGFVCPQGQVHPTLSPGSLSQPAQLMLAMARRGGTIPAPGPFVRDRQVAALIVGTRTQLHGTGHYVRRPRAGAATVPRLVVALVLLVGVVRLIGGLSTGQPSALLILTLIGGLIAALVSARPTWRRSRAGLEQVRHLAAQVQSQPPSVGLHPLAVPLFGAAALLSVLPAAQAWLGKYSPADLQNAGLYAAASGPYSGWAVAHGSQPSSTCSATSCSSSSSCGSSDGGGCGGCGGE